MKQDEGTYGEGNKVQQRVGLLHIARYKKKKVVGGKNVVIQSRWPRIG